MPSQRPIHAARNVIQATAGGWLAGAALGLTEAGLHAATAGAPDAVAPVYAVVLYGLLGLPFGVAAGALFTLVERWWDPGPRAEARALVAGAVFALWPLAGFTGMYLLNKIVFLERGVPPAGLLGLAGALLAITALAWFVAVPLVHGPLRVLRTGPGSLGAWGLLAAVTGVWAVVGAPADPRASFSVPRPMPPALVDRPNVLVIAVDTLRADTLGAYGMDGGISPAIDALAARGVVFEQAIAQASWTRSSFATLWTSRLPSGHNADTKAARLPEELDLVSEVLRDAGVVTGNLVNNINVTATFGFDQGWDVFLYEAPDYSFGATESVFALTFYKVLHKVHEKLSSSKEVSRFYQPADVVLADARQFIEANRERRWMLVAHLMEPHDPYFRHPYLEGTGTAEFDGYGYGRAEHEHPDPAQVDELKRLYRHEITHMDRRIADFIEWMARTGDLDNTAIVLTADHGEEFHEHGGFWHGQTLYDEQIRIPLIVRLPGDALAGTRVPWQVRHLDVAPTIAGLMGVPPSPQWDGLDVLNPVRRGVARRAEVAEEIAALDARIEAEVAARAAEIDPEGAEGAEGAEVAEVAEAVEPSDAEPAAAEDLDALRAARDALEAERVSLDWAALDACAALNRPESLPAVAEQDFEGNVLSAYRAGGAKRIHASTGNTRGLPVRQLFDIANDPGETRDLTGTTGVICDASAAVAISRLDDALKRSLERSAAAGVEGGSAEMDAAEKARLCALGYMSGDDCE